MGGVALALGFIGGVGVFVCLVALLYFGMSYNRVEKIKWVTTIVLTVISLVLIVVAAGVGAIKDCTDYTAGDYRDGDVPIKCRNVYVVPVEDRL